MGRKVNPIGFRLPVRRDWKSRWYAKGRNFTDQVIKDAKARRMIEKKYATAMISRIEIEQKIGSIRLIIHAARPGIIIGKKGEGIERLRNDLRKNIFHSNEVQVDIKEIQQPETDAKVIALNIVNQLENRVMFRRAMRRALSNAMRLKVEGIKIMSAGRLNGIEIARSEWYREGRVPLHTLKNDVDYGFAEANTAMGVVGVKVWVSKGDTYGVSKKAKYTFDHTAPEAETEPAAEPVTDETAAKKTPAVKTVIAKPASAAAEEKKPRVRTVAAKPADKDESADKPAARKAAARKPAVKKAAPKKPAVKTEETSQDQTETE